MKKCGSKTKSGKICGNPAGFKTSHEGEGFCYQHEKKEVKKEIKAITQSLKNNDKAISKVLKKEIVEEEVLSKTTKSNYTTMVEPHLEEISELRANGATIKEIAKRCNVSYSRFRDYVREESALSAAIKRPTDFLVKEIEDSLFKRAMGFEVTETKTSAETVGEGNNKRTKSKVEKVVKHYIPDVTAQIFALKNLAPDKWKDRQDINHSGDAIENLADILNKAWQAKEKE